MQSIKCPQCGLVLMAGSPACKTCGAPLQDRRAAQPTSAYQVGSFDRQQGPSKPHSRLPFLSLVLGWLLLALGNKYGLMIWPIALIAFLTGVVTSVMAIFARKRTQTRLWPAVTGLVINSVLVLNCALVLPIVAFSSLVNSAMGPHWREYVSTDGGYTIQLPEEPIVKFERVNTPAGPLPMHQVSAKLSDNGVCMSIFFDYTGYQLKMTPEEFL